MTKQLELKIKKGLQLPWIKSRILFSHSRHWIKKPGSGFITEHINTHDKSVQYKQIMEVEFHGPDPAYLIPKLPLDTIHCVVFITRGVS